MRQMILSEVAWLRQLCLALLIVMTAALTTVFACITPFVAVGVIAAMTLSRRAALCLMAATWLANQAVGYGVLNYPWTSNSFAWGLALGGAAVVASLTAQYVAAELSAARAPVQALAAFISAFAVYEFVLYALAMSILGGTEGFAPSIVGQVLVVNSVTLIGLYGLNQLAAVVRLVRRRAARVSALQRFA